MATSYPTKPRSAFLKWCEAHQAIFTDHAAAIGLSAEEAAAFNEAVTESRSLQLRQDQIQEEAKAITVKITDAFDHMRRTTGSAMRTIRAFAETAPSPNAVYTLAKISPPAQQSPKPPPGQPSRLTVLLDPTFGTVTLRWNCKNPVGVSGTAYIVRRRLPGEKGFTFVGLTGGSIKTFEDDTLIAGPDCVEYVVQAQRGNQTGPPSRVFQINFGHGSSGRRTATVTTSGAAPAFSATDPIRFNANIPAPVGSGSARVTSR